MGEPRPEQPPDRVDFFISYTGIDRAWAEWISWVLEEADYTTINQAWDFRPGTNFVQSMHQATVSSDRTIMVLSPEYLTSAYATPEWQAAFAQDPTSMQAKLLPVRIRECTPDGLLRVIAYIDLVSQDELVAEGILLDGIPLGRAKPPTRPGFPGDADALGALRPARPRFPGPLPPVWNVPHDRNPNFTGRDSLLSGLYNSLHAGNATVLRQALQGLGGVGKTQLALEYAYRYTADYSVVWWVPSEISPATVYAELTRELDLPEADASESDVRVQAVKRWLEQQEGWLLVFDNATEPDAVKPYLPQGHSGHVIITSRYWDWGDVAEGLGVEVFDRDTESVPFLLRRTSQSDEAAARTLADALGNLPLALAQAAAYIASTGDTLTEYTDLFETRRAELWEEEDAPPDYPKPVGTTWSLTIDELTKEPGAKELLYVLAYLAPEPVSHALLIEGAEHLPEPLGSLVQDRLSWNRMRRAFRRYGLVEVSEAGLSVHRLVQAVTRDRLTEAERQAWAAAAVQVVAAAYPGSTYRPADIRIWVRCAELLSHAQVAADHAGALAVAAEATGRLLDSLAQYLHAQGRYEEAETLYNQALEMAKRLPGDDHSEVATGLNNLALLYHAQGRYKDAETLYNQTLEMAKRLFGDDHSEVATRLNNLALLYHAQGRYEEAKLLFNQALEMRKRLLGDDHSEVADSLNNLALLYYDQGRYEEAKLLFNQALEMRKHLLGDDHPEVAQSLNNLAALYYHQGRYEDAEPLYDQALEMRKHLLGDDHSEVADSLNNLALLYRAQGRYEDVEPLLTQALEMRKRLLSDDHPGVAQSLNNLAALYYHQSRYDQAIPLFEQALEMRVQLLGELHPNTQDTAQFLADAKAAQR